MKDWRIDVEDVAKAAGRKTRLVACSPVSFLNGVRADAKALSEIAHAHGGYLYLDVIHAAGAAPIDVKALGIDFCACSDYKFLMGDRGLGFYYVREDLQGRVAKRFQYGDRQFSDIQYHVFPHDPPVPRPCSWRERAGARSYFEVGNIATVVPAGHADNLRFLNELGVDRIQAHVKPMADRVRRESAAAGLSLHDAGGNAHSDFLIRRARSRAACRENEAGQCRREDSVEPDACIVLGVSPHGRCRPVPGSSRLTNWRNSRASAPPTRTASASPTPACGRLSCS
jgi:selenocysteine lyase/cysteine desulfurase